MSAEDSPALTAEPLLAALLLAIGDISYLIAVVNGLRMAGLLEWNRLNRSPDGFIGGTGIMICMLRPG